MEGVRFKNYRVTGGRVTVLWLPYSLVTVCTDIVTVRTSMAYSNCIAATVQIGNSVH